MDAGHEAPSWALYVPVPVGVRAVSTFRKGTSDATAGRAGWGAGHMVPGAGIGVATALYVLDARLLVRLPRLVAGGAAVSADVALAALPRRVPLAA